MTSANRARANLGLAVLIGGILLLVGLLVGGLAAVVALPGTGIFGEQPVASPTESQSPSPTATAQLPTSDVAGEDLASLPRYPDSVRSDYQVELDERYRLIVTEYLAAAPVDEVLAFYRGVIAAHGWERADIGFTNGEWSYSLVEGDTLALIEIEEAGGLVEIDLQISERLPVSSAQPAVAPTIAPPPPAPPPPGGDDDGDDDDDD